MRISFLPPLFVLCLFAGMLVCLEIGRRIGLRRSGQGSTRAGLSIIEGGFFGLFSLLIAFSFSDAAGRFDQRRALIVEEVNDIGTAYLRIDLLSPEAQPAMRDLFRKYLQSRQAIYRKLPDIDAAKEELAKSGVLQSQIWSQAVESSRLGTHVHPDAGKLLMPAINEMIDITTTRTLAAYTHPPLIIFGLLFVLGLICAAICGQSLAAINPTPWAHILGFALITCISIFVILEIEYPRLGFISFGAHDQAMAELLESMK